MTSQHDKADAGAVPPAPPSLADPLRVSLLQFDAGPTRAANLERLDAWLDRAPPADLIALPEVVTARGSDDDLRHAAESLKSGPSVAFFKAWAQRLRAWLLIGGIIERDAAATYNSAVLIDRDGALASVYRKIHLFEAHLPDGRTVRERDVYRPGVAPVLADIDGWASGLSICFDIRFPGLYAAYAARGASLLLIPANFTRQTGRDHWEILVRARAIENQCFVLAPNQCGTNAATGVAAYGHSLIVDPWGAVLAQADTREQWLSACLAPSALHTARCRIPIAVRDFKCDFIA